MYDNIKAKIIKDGEFSNIFTCNASVRQGENLSPLLFPIFLNDLEEFFIENGCPGLSNISSKLENDLHIFSKLNVLLYADETILLADTADELQKQLTNFYEYANR